VTGDQLGIRPLGEAAKALVEASAEGAKAFLGRICLPAAAEFGLLFQDKVREWRATNALKSIARAQLLFRELGLPEGHHAHPRLVGQIMEHASWADTDELQQMWAGLIASSSDQTGNDDSNLMFIDLLARLSSSQVRILEYGCKTGVLELSAAGWLLSSTVSIILPDLERVAGTDDVQRLDREMDHLRAIGLLAELSGGFEADSTDADLTPSPLALQMYARCCGHRADPVTFYKALGRLEASPSGTA
jgi:hypothetical protein